MNDNIIFGRIKDTEYVLYVALFIMKIVYFKAYLLEFLKVFFKRYKFVSYIENCKVETIFYYINIYLTSCILFTLKVSTRYKILDLITRLGILNFLFPCTNKYFPPIVFFLIFHFVMRLWCSWKKKYFNRS